MAAFFETLSNDRNEGKAANTSSEGHPLPGCTAQNIEGRGGGAFQGQCVFILLVSGRFPIGFSFRDFIGAIAASNISPLFDSDSE